MSTGVLILLPQEVMNGYRNFLGEYVFAGGINRGETFRYLMV